MAPEPVVTASALNPSVPAAAVRDQKKPPVSCAPWETTGPRVSRPSVIAKVPVAVPLVTAMAGKPVVGGVQLSPLDIPVLTKFGPGTGGTRVGSGNSTV